MPVRVLHVLHAFGTGGVETGLRRLVASLDPAEFSHSVLTVAPVDPAADEGMPVSSLGSTGTFLVPAFYRAIAAARPDIVHTRNWSTIEAVLAARLARTKAVIHAEHGRNLADLGEEPLRRRAFRRLAYELADRVVTVSEEMRRYFASKTGFARERIAIMKDGVDDERFRPDPAVRDRIRASLGIGPAALVLGCVARLDPVKDFPTLLAAADRVAEEGIDVHVLLIGDGPERQSLGAEAEARPRLHGRVAFPGNLSNVPDWLNALDVFVLPSRFEGISVALLEAMAIGLPTIATRVGGNGEVVVEGETGLMIDPGDVAGLADAVIALGRDPARRLAMGDKGRDRVRDEFSRRANTERYAELYRSVLSSKAHR